MSTEEQLFPEKYNLQEREVDMFANAWGEFKAYRAHIDASSKLRGVKDVIYDEEYLKQVVGDLLKHRPANVRVSISSEMDGQVVKTDLDSSLLAFQNLVKGHQTMLYSEGEVNASVLQYEIDHAFGLNEKSSEELEFGQIMLEEGLQGSEHGRPLAIGIADVRLDSPGIDVVAQNVVHGTEEFDQQAGSTSYMNGLDGQESTEFVINFDTTDYQVGIRKEQAGGERVPGLDVQIGMLLLKQLGLPPEEAGNLGDLGPVYTQPVNNTTEDAF